MRVATEQAFSCSVASTTCLWPTCRDKHNTLVRDWGRNAVFIVEDQKVNLLCTKSRYMEHFLHWVSCSRKDHPITRFLCFRRRLKKYALWGSWRKVSRYHFILNQLNQYNWSYRLYYMEQHQTFDISLKILLFNKYTRSICLTYFVLKSAALIATEMASYRFPSHCKSCNNIMQYNYHIKTHNKHDNTLLNL